MSVPKLTVQAFAAAKARVLLFASLVSAISVWEGTPTRAFGNRGRDTNVLVSQSDGHNLVGTPMQHDSYIFSAQFSPDGRQVVTASKDGTARLWDAATGKAIGEPMKHDDEVASARFSPDGNRVVTASWDTARVWDVASVSGKETARAALLAPRNHAKPEASVGPKPD